MVLRKFQDLDNNVSFDPLRLLLSTLGILGELKDLSNSEAHLPKLLLQSASYSEGSQRFAFGSRRKIGCS